MAWWRLLACLRIFQSTSTLPSAQAAGGSRRSCSRVLDHWLRSRPGPYRCGNARRDFCTAHPRLIFRAFLPSRSAYKASSRRCSIAPRPDWNHCGPGTARQRRCTDEGLEKLVMQVQPTLSTRREHRCVDLKIRDCLLAPCPAGQASAGSILCT